MPEGPRPAARVCLPALLLLALLGAGCGGGDGDTNGVACTAVYVYGVNVRLSDASTGLAVEGATCTLTEGPYEEVLVEIYPGEYAGAGERPGTYRLNVEAAGYEDAERENVFVDADICHVIPVALEIGLTPR